MTSNNQLNDEIEITPAMLAAGVTVFFGFDERFESASDCVADIFRAMFRVKVNHEAALGSPNSDPILQF